MDLIELKSELDIKGIYTLKYQEKDTGFIFPGEIHDFWELIYMDKGFAYLLLDDKGYKVNQGELFLFSKNQNHIVWSDSKVAPCFLTISFEMEFIDEKYFEHKRFKVDDEIKDVIRKIINERAYLFEGDINSGSTSKRAARPVGSEQLLKMYISELMLKLYRLGDCHVNSSASSTIKQKSENVIMKKCMDFINGHINERIYIEQVCGCVPISQSYLNKIFKSNIGIPVMEYIIEAKLEKAKSLIRESGLSLTEISCLLGFSSIHYFSRLFKNKYHTSPSEYAKSIKAIT